MHVHLTDIRYPNLTLQNQKKKASPKNGIEKNVKSTSDKTVKKT